LATFLSDTGTKVPGIFINMNLSSEIKQSFREGSVLTRLIYINLGLFGIVKLFAVFVFLFGYTFSFSEWFSVTSDLNGLAKKPWTPITYMFYHEGFMHLLFNILGLYWFGKLFMMQFEGQKLLSVYLIGGIMGALFYVASYNLFPVFENTNSILMGASASVIAILVAIAVYNPNHEIHLFLIGRFPLKYLALFYVLLSVLSISVSNPGGNIAHLGGAFWGWFYIFSLRRGKDFGYWLVKLINKTAGLFKKREKMKVSYKNAPRDDYEYNRTKNQEQEEINKILDKIAQSGYDSLSKNEKELLFKQGR
jgi:membrane associated rhomboid family serine protease